jgi:hypothetical protein
LFLVIAQTPPVPIRAIYRAPLGLVPTVSFISE